jgi:hypothetical protein
MGNEQMATKPTFEQAAEERRVSFVSEVTGFLRDNKAWWLLPIVVVLAAVGVLALFAGTGVAPFIYALF